jgi:hypothetical protein
MAKAAIIVELRIGDLNWIRNGKTAYKRIGGVPVRVILETKADERRKAKASKVKAKAKGKAKPRVKATAPATAAVGK